MGVGHGVNSYIPVRLSRGQLDADHFMSRTSFAHSILCYVIDRYYIANKTANTGLLVLIMRVSSVVAGTVTTHPHRY